MMQRLDMQRDGRLTQAFHLGNAVHSASFWIWCALLSFPLMTVERNSADSTLAYQVVGLLQYSVIAFAVHRARLVLAPTRFDKLQWLVLAVIVFSLALQFHGDEGAVAAGIAYTILLLAEVLLLSLIWTMPPEEIERCLAGVALVLAVFGISAIALLGWPEERNVGGIHPNFFGTIVLIGFIFSLFRKSAAMSAARLVCFGLAAIVSSRFAVIGCIIALLVYEATCKPRLYRLAALACAGGVLVLLFSGQIADVLALSDPDRGLGSGFTGRDNEWSLALDSIARDPFGVGFKRQPTDVAGHNGYLKTMIELGIPGGSIMIAAMLCIVVRAVFDAAVLSGGRDADLQRFASARAAGLAALTFASFFQPQIFNFGDIHGISFMLLLFSPPPGGSRERPAFGVDRRRAPGLARVASPRVVTVR